MNKLHSHNLLQRIIFVIFLLIFFSCHKRKNLKKTYYKTGQLKEIIEINNDSIPNGEYLKYYPNGNIFIKTKYQLGDLNDTIYFYFKNGNLWLKGRYKNGLKYDWWLVYDSLTNKNKDSIQYIIRNDTAFINQGYVFEDNKLLKDESLFYKFITQDTLNKGINIIKLIINIPNKTECKECDSAKISNRKIVLVNYLYNGDLLKKDSIVTTKDTVDLQLFFNNNGKYTLKGMITYEQIFYEKKMKIIKTGAMLFTKDIYIIN